MSPDTKRWCKIKRKTDICLEKQHKEFGIFSCEKIWTLIGSFLSTAYKDLAGKIQKFQKWHEVFGEFSSNHSKLPKFFFYGLFCPKYMRFEVKKYIGVIFHETEQWWKMTWLIGLTFLRALKVWKIVQWALFAKSI